MLLCQADASRNMLGQNFSENQRLRGSDRRRRPQSEKLVSFSFRVRVARASVRARRSCVACGRIVFVNARPQNGEMYYSGCGCGLGVFAVICMFFVFCFFIQILAICMFFLWFFVLLMSCMCMFFLVGCADRPPLATICVSFCVFDVMCMGFLIGLRDRHH